MGNCCVSRLRFYTAKNQLELKKFLEIEISIIEKEPDILIKNLQEDLNNQLTWTRSVKSYEEKQKDMKRGKAIKDFLTGVSEIVEYLDKFTFSNISEISLKLHNYFENLYNEEQFNIIQSELIKFLQTNMNK